jgi:signal transduction histidine kinase
MNGNPADFDGSENGDFSLTSPRKMCRMTTVNQSTVQGKVPRRSRIRVPRRIALIDSEGKIVAVNKDWMTLAEETGANRARTGPGASYLDVCRRAGRDSAEPRKALAGIWDVLKEKTPSFGMDYACQSPSGPAYFRMNVTPIEYKNARVAISHTDITNLQLAKIKDSSRLQQFARRLIHAQEEERRRISREIHDDLGSRIAFMSFSVRRLMEQSPKGLESSATTLTELNKVVEGLGDLATALRNMSHHLHPPSLQYVGIVGALKSLRKAFEEMYGVQVDIRVPARMPELSEAAALCIFRVSQECLQNIAKHSGAMKCRIVLEHSHEQVQLVVSDYGRGFVRSDAIARGGIGLLSMEERALSIGGCVTVKSGRGAGTEVRLTIPLQKPVEKFMAV